MLIESVVVGVVGSLLGSIAGVGVSAALKGFLGVLGVDFPSTTLQLLPRTIVLTIVLGTLVTVLSALLPALRTGRVSPLAAMRDSAIEHTSAAAASGCSSGWSLPRSVGSASSPRSPAPAASCSASVCCWCGSAC